MDTCLPSRPAGLAPGAASSIGILVDCPLRPADVWIGIESVAGPGWSTYGRYDDRIAWTHRGRLRKRWFALMLLLAIEHGGASGYDTNDDGWLIIEVDPGPGGFGSTIEARGELDEAMFRSLDEALSRLGVTIVESWDPLAPDPEEDDARSA